MWILMAYNREYYESNRERIIAYRTARRMRYPCADCAKPCSRAGGRCKSCAQKGALNSHWMGDTVRPETGRKRAQSTFSFLIGTPCIDCGEPSCDLHHEDHNPSNNA